MKKEFGNTQPKRSLDIGIVDVKDGHYVDFSDKNITQGANLVDAMYASLSFAGFSLQLRYLVAISSMVQLFGILTSFLPLTDALRKVLSNKT